MNFYCEMGCLFAHCFAILSRNVVFIGSLLRASCGLKFQLADSRSSSVVLEVKSDVSGTVKTLEDRYASFYVQNPITDFTELLERVKKVVLFSKVSPTTKSGSCTRMYSWGLS